MYGIIFMEVHTMLLQFVWVMISLFAVIGITVCLMEVLKSLSFRKVHSVERVNLQVVLCDNEPRAEYLINSLLLLCDQLEFNQITPGLELIDGGITEETRKTILEYCEKNPRVVFTEEVKNDIISTSVCE